MTAWKLQKLQWLVPALSVGVAADALVAYSRVPLGKLVHPQMKLTFEAHRAAILTHIFCCAIASGVQGYRAIRARRVSAHRQWMLRNFALTFAAVTLRIYLGTFAAMGIPFESFYAWLGWLCWVPNVMFIEWYIHRSESPA